MPKAAKERAVKTVLIVEDSPDFASLLKFIVEDDGFQTMLFPVEESDIVQWVVRHTPAVILMDLALRRKDGMEFINALKGNSETKNTPIIVITGRDLGTREMLDLEFKGVKYMRKGRVELDEIKDEVRAAVHGQRSTVSHQKKSG